MHAIQVTQQKNEGKDLKWTKVDKPVPKAGEVLVKLKLRPIDPADVFSIMGVYPGFNKDRKYPAVPGLEGMGVVEQVGDGVTAFKVGQRVVPLFFAYTQNGNGSWREYAVFPERDVTAVPDSVKDQDAAHYVVNPFTVYGMLEELQVPKGEFLLQSAAGSTLGRQVIQVCKSRGIKTINLVRRKELEAELKAIGADYVICTESEDVVKRVTEIAGNKKAYAAVECVGNKIADLVTHCVRDNGKVLLYGLMDGMTIPLDAANLLFHQVALQGYWVTPWFLALPQDKKDKVCASVWEWYTSGVLTPHTGEIHKIENVAEALDVHSKSARGGKVLLSSE